jgi:hypothetical protein
VLLTQLHLFPALRDALPETTDRIIPDGRIPVFRDAVRELWQLFKRKYPEQCAAWEAART